MSRKTKAELLVDIDELTTEVKRLKRTLEIRNDNIRMLLDMSDEDQRHLKLLEKAHDDTIDTLIVRRNERDHLFNEKHELEETNRRRGGNSYKCYKKIYRLADRYFRFKRRHDPGYFPGKAAREVWEYCDTYSDRFKYVPAQKTINKHLKK